jgi:hypothetical protein
MPDLLQVKEEGWWLVAGDSRTGELYALKRVSFGQRTTARLVGGWVVVCGGLAAGGQWAKQGKEACVPACSASSSAAACSVSFNTWADMIWLSLTDTLPALALVPPAG